MTEILNIYAWADFMPGCGTGELMCSITFNTKVNTLKVKQISVYNNENLEHVHDLSVIDGYRYEQRDNQIIIREGPEWKGLVYVKIVIEEDDNEKVLKSNSVKVQHVC